jgi:hypothetical protein
MIQKNATKLALSQIFMITGMLLTAVGLVGAVAVDSHWFYFCAAGIVCAALGLLMLSSLVKQTPNLLKKTDSKDLSKNGITKLVLQNNVIKLVSGLALAISGALMNGVGLIAGFAANSIWFYLCVIGLASMVVGIWLMQGEIRSIVSALRKTVAHR